jgi:acyl-CoA thioesterase-1
LTRHRLVRQTLVGGAALLAAALACSSVVVALGATVLAVEPAAPRDRAAPASASPAGRPLRLTVLGTSLSSAGRYRWPDEVGAQLSARIGRPVEVHRVAQPGATSTWGTAQVERVVATRPDIVVVELAVNDADVRHHLTVGASVSRHERVLTGLAAARPEATVVLLTMSPASGPRAWVRPFLSRYYAAYVALAQRCDVGLVDLYPRWNALPATERELNDGLHPSDAAATRVVVGPLVDSLASAAGR